MPGVALSWAPTGPLHIDETVVVVLLLLFLRKPWPHFIYFIILFLLVFMTAKLKFDPGLCGTVSACCLQNPTSCF